MKKVLFIQHHSPYQGFQAQETLDALLVMAAFGQNPSVLFQGDSVWQLMANQQATDIGRASIVAQLQALSLYDVEQVYVDRLSLQQRGLTFDDISIKAQVITAQELAHFIHQHDIIIRL